MAPPSRRTTLGPVPTSTNRRTSLGGPPPVSDATKKKKSARGRVSMLPRMSGARDSLHRSPSPSSRGGAHQSQHRSQTKPTAFRRRVSVGGDTLNANAKVNAKVRRQSLAPPPLVPQKSDPRPISEKGYQNSCMKRLLHFLVSSSPSYAYPVSLKSLSRPSGKDFQNVVTFLLRRIDPTFHDGTMKLEDEVAMHFKALGYPFPISKTALVAAGSPHTWPALLAALTWLTELIQTTETQTKTGADFPTNTEDSNDTDTATVTATFESLQDLEQKTDKAFFQYLSGAYTAFLNGESTITEKLEEGLVDMFEKDNMVIENEIERVTDLNGTIVEKMNHLGQQSQDLPTLEQKREDYATDLEQFHDLVRQMDEHKDALDKKVKKNTTELQDIDQKLQKMTARVDQLKSQVQSQEYSVEDVRRMQGEQNRLEEAMERSCALKQKCSKELFDSDLDLTRLTEELQTTIDEYNAKVTVLPLGDTKAKIGLNKRNVHQREQHLLLGVDLKEVVVPAIQQCKVDYFEQTVNARNSHQELLDQLEASEAAVTEALDGLKIVQEKQSKCDEMLITEKKEQDGALAVRLREVQAAETKIASLRDPVAMEETLVRYQRQCIQLEALQAKQQEDNIARKDAVKDEIHAALRMLEEHREHQKMKLIELEHYIAAKQASLGKVELPPSLNV